MKLEEIAPPSGGPFGSTYVDLEFEKFLQDLVGDDAFGRFKPSGEWVALISPNNNRPCPEIEFQTAMIKSFIDVFYHQIRNGIQGYTTRAPPLSSGGRARTGDQTISSPMS